MNSEKKSIETEYGLISTDDKPYEIPLNGSIGLLTLGYRGLMAWRAKRIESYQNRQSKENASGK